MEEHRGRSLDGDGERDNRQHSMRERLYPHFQCPKGGDGREVLKAMNLHHRDLTDWALSFLGDLRPSKVLDIGCGGGMALSKLGSRFPESALHGVDISEEAICHSRDTNVEAARAGRLHLSVGSVSDLPFPDGSFDLVTAVETYFFWPDLPSDLGEAARVLASGGVLLVVSETYPHPDFVAQNEENAVLYSMRLVENEEMESILRGHGLEVATHLIEARNWVAFLARKPA